MPAFGDGHGFYCVAVRSEASDAVGILGRPVRLRCGVRLKNRLVKAAMSDSLGDGVGGVTDEQVALYRRWVSGGAALSIIGEVQVDPKYPETPGNLVLGDSVDAESMQRLASVVASSGSHIWPQLGHAGAMADPRVADPVGPSRLDVDGVSCREMTTGEIEALPEMFGRAARRACDFGFSGVEIHAAHGFLLSQFLSPLFNHRRDAYGGSAEARSRLLLEVIGRVRQVTNPGFAVGVKINATDELVGGFDESDSLAVIEMLGTHGVDLIDVSGGTYFPGATSSSDRPSSGPYYVEFARRARRVTDTTLMLTGGVKTQRDAEALISDGIVDMVGLARPMVLDPDLANHWTSGDGEDPVFPRFTSSPPGGVTAWYTMRLTDLAHGRRTSDDSTPHSALAEYNERDSQRAATWRQRHEQR